MIDTAVAVVPDTEPYVIDDAPRMVGAAPAMMRTAPGMMGTEPCDCLRSAEATRAMVLRHTGLVRQIAQHMHRRMPDTIDLDDLIQTGMVGLLEAVQRYEGRKGSSFVTYAMRRIRGAILDAARRSDWSPRSLRRRLRDIEGARRRLELQTGDAPTAAAVAEAVGITRDQYYRAMRDYSASVQLSLDEPLPAESGQAWAEPADDNPGPAEAAEREETLLAMTAAIEALPEHERAILLLYYGEEHLMREIGATFDVSESRICQIHKRTIERLRAATR